MRDATEVTKHKSPATKMNVRKQIKLATEEVDELSAGSRIIRTVSAGSHFRGGSKRSRTVSAEAKYDGHSLQEAKISGLVYTLWA